MRKFGGKFHRKLNISSSPIANKYHEGKVKSTLKRELNVPEIVVNQAIGINVVKELEQYSGSLEDIWHWWVSRLDSFLQSLRSEP